MQSILQDYGLSEKEAKIYLTILEIGEAGVTTIARRSGVKRVSVYAVLDSLKKQDIAFESEKNGVKIFTVISPSILFKNFEKKYQKFKESLPEMMDLPNRFGNVPKMQFFDGQNQVEQMLYNYSDTWIKSISQYDKTWWGYQDVQFVEAYMPRLRRYRNKQVPGEKISLLSNAAKIEEEIGEELEKTNNRIIKSIPEGLEFDSTVRILGDYIVMIMAQGRKHHAFQIQDQYFARNLREVFKLLWSNYSMKIHK